MLCGRTALSDFKIGALGQQLLGAQLWLANRLFSISTIKIGMYY